MSPVIKNLDDYQTANLFPVVYRYSKKNQTPHTNGLGFQESVTHILTDGRVKFFTPNFVKEIRKCSKNRQLGIGDDIVGNFYKTPDALDTHVRVFDVDTNHWKTLIVGGIKDVQALNLERLEPHGGINAGIAYVQLFSDKIFGNLRGNTRFHTRAKLGCWAKIQWGKTHNQIRRFPFCMRLKPVKEIVDLKEKHRREIWNLEYRLDNMLKEMRQRIDASKALLHRMIRTGVSINSDTETDTETDTE